MKGRPPTKREGIRRPRAKAAGWIVGRLWKGSKWRVLKGDEVQGVASMTPQVLEPVLALCRGSVFRYRYDIYQDANEGSMRRVGGIVLLWVGVWGECSGPPSLPMRGYGGDEDFAARCGTPGVIRCFGFDSQAEVDPHVMPPAGQREKRGIVVTDITASGAGALRFEVPPFSGSDTSGSFWLNFAEDLSAQFGEGRGILYSVAPTLLSRISRDLFRRRRRLETVHRRRGGSTGGHRSFMHPTGAGRAQRLPTRLPADVSQWRSKRRAV